MNKRQKKKQIKKKELAEKLDPTIEFILEEVDPKKKYILMVAGDFSADESMKIGESIWKQLNKNRLSNITTMFDPGLKYTLNEINNKEN